MSFGLKAGLAWACKAGAVCVGFLALALPTIAQEDAQLFVTEEAGFGRMILSFPGRIDMPDYDIAMDNGILSIVFDDAEIDLLVPDISAILPDYVSIARVDPDRGGLRFGLRTALNFNSIEAGEKLFIDLLPMDWQGLPPSLPQAVIDELAERARLAAIAAERDRKARDVAELDPQAEVRIGRNPTFLRLQFLWNVDTDAEYLPEGDLGSILFEWPVDIDLSDLIVDLPPEILAAGTAKTPDGSSVDLQFAEGIVPRFYVETPRSFTLDIDLDGVSLPSIAPEDLAAEVETAAEPEAETLIEPPGGMLAAQPEAPITPYVTTAGASVRLVFPFERDTPAAVFRRGNTLWMLFDTGAGINAPTGLDALDPIASGIEINPTGDTQVVRLDLSQDRLATLGSEGRAWVLSLGDLLLSPTQPLELVRRTGLEGGQEMTADLERPGRVHQFRDPLVGDMLQVVTAYPPARGVTRSFDFVDFTALRSVHGLVIRPEHHGVETSLDASLAVISSADGLTLTALDQIRTETGASQIAIRDSFFDMAALERPDPQAFIEQASQFLAAAADSTAETRDAARIELAQFYLANRFAHEALGTLGVIDDQRMAPALNTKLRMARGVANTLAHRPHEALALLQGSLVGGDVDAVLWRAIAHADALDYERARQDILAAEPILSSYPAWVQNRFHLAGARAGIETADSQLAGRMLDDIDHATLSPSEAATYTLLTGRLAELDGHATEAIETYGQVIASEDRPTRAEAIFRTLKILDEAGTLDVEKASQTLAAESLLWRGGPLEADMQAMLAGFYFRDGAYRLAFDITRQSVSQYPESPPINALRDTAQTVFAELFLDGRADSLGPIDALALYYDFRALTPPGARGDEMVRNLARRLVDVDLLGQAAELLEYQLDNRLTGAARSQLAADLAIIYLADRQPQQALDVLNRSRLPGLSDALTRQRRVLEAKALIDANRNDLALDLLGDIEGQDAAVLRVDAHWRARRYDEAAALLEAMQSGAGAQLSQPGRMNLVRAGVGFVLADDQFGLSRLRAKFADAMVTTPEWPLFDFVTSSIEPTSLEFRKLAGEVAGLDSVDAFLDAYRSVYGAAGALVPVSGAPGADVAALN